MPWVVDEQQTWHAFPGWPLLREDNTCYGFLVNAIFCKAQVGAEGQRVEVGKQHDSRIRHEPPKDGVVCSRCSWAVLKVLGSTMKCPDGEPDWYNPCGE